MCWITSTTGVGKGGDAAEDAALDAMVVVSPLTERSSVLETSDDIVWVVAEAAEAAEGRRSGLG